MRPFVLFAHQRFRYLPLILAVLILFALQLSAENKTLKGELEHSLSGKIVVSKIVFGGRATPPGYQADYPVNTLVYPDSSEPTFRVEWGLMRAEIGAREMLRYFDRGTSFRVSNIDLKDDRLEFKLESGSGDSAKLKLMLGAAWQSKFDMSSVQTQLARVFVLDQLQEAAPVTTVAGGSMATPSGIGSAGSTLHPELLEDSKALAAVLNECKRHSGSLISHAVGDLQKRLGKEMTPKDPADITSALRIVDDCTAYLSSPGLVSGMELPAAQEARREADNTLQKLDEISRKLAATDLRSLEARTREHLQSPTASQPGSVRQSALSESSVSGAAVQPLAVYQRASNAPDLPGRTPPEAVQAIIAEASQEAKRDTDIFLSEAASTVSADLLAIQSATMRYPNFASHPLMQSITALKRQLGKSLRPKNVTDVETITELLSRTLRIFGGSEFAPAYGHVDAERKTIQEYTARQSAISSTVSTIIEIEQTLDQGSLIAADGRYQQVATDRFMSGFSPAQHYLAETAVLRSELSAYREATQVPRVQQTQPSVTQISVLADEVAKAENYNGKLLATEVLKRNVVEDKQAVQSRLASLPAFDFDPSMYRTQQITNETVAQEMTARLRGLSGKLSSARDLTDLLASQDIMAKVRLLYGEAVEAELRRKGKSIPSAQQMVATLSNAIQTHQQQVAEAEVRRQAEAEEQQALAGKIVNGALIVTMLEEKFQRTSIMGYQMEANKQRQELRNLLQRDRKLLTSQVWKAVQSQFERLMPGLTVYQASATQAFLSNLRRGSN